MSTHPVGGRGGIWTHGRFDPPPVFKTGVLSQTLPPYRVGGSVRTRTLNNPVMSRVLLPVELLTQMFSTLSLLENYTNKLWCGNLYSALPFISAIRPDDTLPNTWFHSYAISELISDVLIGGDGAGDETRTRTVSPPRDFLTTLTYDFVSQRCCCSLEYVFAISFDLGSGYILSTHLSQTKTGFTLTLCNVPSNPDINPLGRVFAANLARRFHWLFRRFSPHSNKEFPTLMLNLFRYLDCSKCQWKSPLCLPFHHTRIWLP